MKLVVLMLALSTFSLLSFAESTTVQIQLTAKAEVLTVKAACVARVDFDGGGNYDLYFDSKSYKAVAVVEQRGFSTPYMAGNSLCTPSSLFPMTDGKRADLTYVDVGMYEKASEIDKAILENGGYKEIQVVFYNFPQLEKEFRASTKAAFEKLLSE